MRFDDFGDRQALASDVLVMCGTSGWARVKRMVGDEAEMLGRALSDGPPISSAEHLALQNFQRGKLAALRELVAAVERVRTGEN